MNPPPAPIPPTRDTPAGWRTCSGERGGGCFTLLETMVVVVLLSLAMMMLAGSLVGGDAAARAKSTAREILDLDRRARLIAATDGAMVIVPDQDGGAVLLRRAGSAERIATVQVPPDVTVQLLDGETGMSIESVRVGAHGRSRDYIIVVRPRHADVRGGRDDVSTAEHMWRIAGLTGCAMTATGVDGGEGDVAGDGR